jgi:hypothetical protein
MRSQRGQPTVCRGAVQDKKIVNSETEDNAPARKATRRERRAHARLDWSGKQPTTKLQIVAQRQQRLHRPQDLRRAGSVSGIWVRAR